MAARALWLPSAICHLPSPLRGRPHLRCIHRDVAPQIAERDLRPVARGFDERGARRSETLLFQDEHVACTGITKPESSLVNRHPVGLEAGYAESVEDGAGVRIQAKNDPLVRIRAPQRGQAALRTPRSAGFLRAHHCRVGFSSRIDPEAPHSITFPRHAVGPVAVSGYLMEDLPTTRIELEDLPGFWHIAPKVTVTPF